MPRSRNTRIRAKNTSRAEARRRHRDDQREDDIVPNTLSGQVDAIQMEEPPKRSMLALPDIRSDLRALPAVFKKPLVWAPFGMLLVAFVIGLAGLDKAKPDDQVSGLTSLYFELTLPPTSLFVFFIGGFVAERASYLVGAILGAFDALLLTILNLDTPNATQEGSGVTEASGGFLLLWVIAIFVGTFAAGFAAWYKRFLRSSQERARANRAIKEKEQAEKAKERARADKQAARDARKG